MLPCPYPTRQPRHAASGARAIFSPSPIHLDVSEEAEMAKKVARMLAATALPSSVLPVPAGCVG